MLLIALPTQAQEAAARTFAGLNFGVGVSLTVDTGDRDRIDEATIVDGIVRAHKESNSRARVILESHYFFTPNKDLFNVKAGDWGVGPFIGLQPGTDEIIEALGAGIMIGFKRGGEKTSSWNLGLGVMVDPNVQVLGDGFDENRAPPGNETSVRFKEDSQVGILLITSFAF